MVLFLKINVARQNSNILFNSSRFLLTQKITANKLWGFFRMYFIVSWLLAIIVTIQGINYYSNANLVSLRDIFITDFCVHDSPPSRDSIIRATCSLLDAFEGNNWRTFLDSTVVYMHAISTIFLLGSNRRASGKLPIRIIWRLSHRVTQCHLGRYKMWRHVL